MTAVITKSIAFFYVITAKHKSHKGLIILAMKHSKGKCASDFKSIHILSTRFNLCHFSAQVTMMKINKENFHQDIKNLKEKNHSGNQHDNFLTELHCRKADTSKKSKLITKKKESNFRKYFMKLTQHITPKINTALRQHRNESIAVNTQNRA